MAAGMNSIGSSNTFQPLASANLNSQQRKVAGTDADGDNDGSKPAEAATKPQSASLTIGTRIDTTA